MSEFPCPLVLTVFLPLLTQFPLSFRCMDYAVDVFVSGFLMPFSLSSLNNLIYWEKNPKNQKPSWMRHESDSYQGGKCESCKSGARLGVCSVSGLEACNVSGLGVCNVSGLEVCNVSG